MSSSIEFLLQKYGISPKPSQSHPSLFHHSSVPDLRTSQLKSSDLSSTQDLDLLRAKSEISSLKSQLASLLQYKETNLTQKTLDLESQLKIHSARNRSLEEQIVFLNTQLEFYQTESKRMADQHAVENGNWAMQLESLKRQLQYRQIEGNSNLSSVKMEKEENRMLKDQILQMKSNEEGLTGEVERLKRELERERNKMQEVVGLKEIELKTSQGDYQLSLQQLRQENEKIQQLCVSLNMGSSEKDRKIKELENVLRLSEEAREALKKQQTATQDFIKDVVSVNEQLAGSLQKGGKKQPRSSSNKEKPILKSSKTQDSLRRKVIIPSYLNQEGKLQATIQGLEEEIQEINRNYKKLLIKTHDGTSDYLKYKEEIDGLAKMLEEKSKTLFTAKRRYSSLVREKIINEAMN